VPGPTTTVATLDVDRQNVPALAIKARFPNIAFQTTMVAKIGVAARKASIFLAFKILSYVSQVIGHKFDTLPSFCSRLARIFHELLAATTDLAVLPGVLGCRPLQRTVQVRLGTNPLRLPGGKPTFVVSRQQFMKYPSYVTTFGMQH